MPLLPPPCSLPLCLCSGPQPAHHQAPAEEAGHEPDLQAEVAGVGPVRLALRHQQEGIGHDADQGEGDEGEPHEAGALSSAHGEAATRMRARSESEPGFPGPEKKNKPGSKVQRSGRRRGICWQGEIRERGRRPRRGGGGRGLLPTRWREAAEGVESLTRRKWPEVSASFLLSCMHLLLSARPLRLPAAFVTQPTRCLLEGMKAGAMPRHAWWAVGLKCHRVRSVL